MSGCDRLILGMFFPQHYQTTGKVPTLALFPVNTVLTLRGPAEGPSSLSPVPPSPTSSRSSGCPLQRGRPGWRRLRQLCPWERAPSSHTSTQLSLLVNLPISAGDSTEAISIVASFPCTGQAVEQCWALMGLLGSRTVRPVHLTGNQLNPGTCPS